MGHEGRFASPRLSDSCGLRKETVPGTRRNEREAPIPDGRGAVIVLPESVESRCGAVAVGRTYLLPPLSFGGASLARPWLCFHTSLIEPDMQISRIRLSDKTSRLRPRLAARSGGRDRNARK